MIISMNAVSLSRSHAAAFVMRTAALLILLYQVRLLAADLADTSFFTASLAGGLAAAIFLNQVKINGRNIRPLQALAAIALVPWTIRFFIALPRWFFTGVSDAAIILDSLLLNMDRNNFAVLFPFYWLAASSYFSQRSRVFLRADIIAASTFFLVLFSIVPVSGAGVYRWPILMAGIFALVFFLQLLALIFSMPPEFKLHRKEKIFASVIVFFLIFAGGALFIKPLQQRAVERGGGLIEPKLFRFDFSQFIKLESEISMSDELVLIIKKDPNDSHDLLRRYTLSGYNRKQGFFRHEYIDEYAHPQRLPNRRSFLPSNPEKKNFRVSEQEYFIVNFDSTAFIGMNEPVEVIPFETWDASSFNSAYAVKSHTSEAMPYELIDAVPDKHDPQSFALSPEEYALYTEYGGDETIAALALEIIHGPSVRFGRREEQSLPSYWEQIQMIYDRLKYGEFSYSLKPGIASDGDQLKHFLFTSKKGYCSYYAFAFTLMLRSLGIPSRVAAGFFMDPQTEAFNYYPVRADMAHAWAEVWFPGYGWIEYDPTSVTLAEGEEFRFSAGTPPELFERLIKEILDKRSELSVKEGDETEGVMGSLAAIGRITLGFLSKTGPFIGAAALAFLFLFIRSGRLWLFRLRKKPRKKALLLWSHTKRRLALAGLARLGAGWTQGRAAEAGASQLAEAEWAKAADSRVKGIYPLYLDAAAARFAPGFHFEDCANMAEHYRLFSNEYRKAVPIKRRILAWFLPPLALLLKAPVKTLLLVSVFVSLLCQGILAQDTPAQNGEPPAQGSDLLYENALAAERAENWERAIGLFSSGIKSYPSDFRFSWSLGNLYFNRSLYRLAWDEYRRAEEIIYKDSDTSELRPSVPGLLYQLANTAGYLNKNEESSNYLERYLALEPDNREAIGSLAWMYFKLHQYEEGEKLLLEAIARMGEDMDFSMTLGTIYSGMFRYLESKDSYLRAIRGAEASGDRLFAALSHYNLSILESRFYEYGLAFDRANLSLEAMNRASGRLARGELYLTRMELAQTLADYQEAYSMDSSPLSKLNLSELYRIGGQLNDAALYAGNCLKALDESWMMNYGIDPVRYKRDIHEILKDTYEGLYKAEAFFCPEKKSGFGATIKQQIQSVFRKVSYRFRFAVHTHLYHKYSLLAADAYEGNSGLVYLEALIQYYNAFDAYPRRALAYLRQARSIEEPLIPGSTPSYNFEEGRLLKSRKILAETLGEFDPIWERDKIADVYAKLALSGRKTNWQGTANRQDAAERLFAINRGALLQNGTRLPVELRITDDMKRAERVLKKAALAAGLEQASLASPRFTLTIGKGGEGYAFCELYDNGRGVSVWKESLNIPSGSQKAVFTRALRDGIFKTF